MKYIAYGCKEDEWGDTSYQLFYGDSIEEIEAKLINNDYQKGEDGIFRGRYIEEGYYDKNGHLEPYYYRDYVYVSIESTEDL